MEMRNLKAPAARLAARVLADDAVEPPLEAAGELEVRPVDGQDERVVEERGIEPVGDDELDPERPAVGAGALLPLVDPGEAMHAPLRGLAQRRRNRCRLQAVKRRFEAVIITDRGTAADE